MAVYTRLPIVCDCFCALKDRIERCDRDPSQACRAQDTCSLGLSGNIDWSLLCGQKLAGKRLSAGNGRKVSSQMQGCTVGPGGPLAWPPRALGRGSWPLVPGSPLLGLRFRGRPSELPFWTARGQGRGSGLHPSLPPHLRILGSLAESSMQTKASFYLWPPISVVLRTWAVPSRHSAFSNTDSVWGMNHRAVWLWRRRPGCRPEHLPAGGRVPFFPQRARRQSSRTGGGDRTHTQPAPSPRATLSPLSPARASLGGMPL